MPSRRVLMPSLLAFGMSVVAAQQDDSTGERSLEPADPVYAEPLAEDDDPGIDEQAHADGDATGLIAAPLPADHRLEPIALPARGADSRWRQSAASDGLAPIDVAVPATRPLESTAPSDAQSSLLTNAEIVAMVEARFSSATIIAAMDVNDAAFDVSPAGLLALKSADVPDRVIEAMIRIEAERRSAANAATDDSASIASAAAAGSAAPADPTATGNENAATAVSPAAPAAAAPAEGTAAAQSAEPAMTPETVAMLSEALKRLSETRTVPEPQAVAEPPTRRGPGPHAWVAADEDRIALASSTAEVALTDNKSRGSSALGALRGLSEKALAFATPALGIANELELGGLFRNSDPKMTAVWALPGASASRELAPDTVFEIEFNNIPGVNPDDYRPKIVELVPTRDNYRLVGAARARLSEFDEGLPAEPIIEEPAASEIRPLGRGRYRITIGPDLPPGEYALVLRPVDRTRARREDETSLSSLMGASGSDILYVTWDFSIRT